MAPSRSRTIDERSFHAWLARTARGDRFNRLPPGDDVAALTARPGERGLVALSTDAFTEGTHFRRANPPRAVGRALAEANLSDLASKGALPIGFLLDALLPGGTPLRWAKEVVRGVRDALRPYGVDLSGGDTKWAPRPVLVGTAVGYLPPGPIPRRGGARAGDRLLVTGSVGRGGWASLPGTRGRARGEELRIRARVRAGIALRPHAHAMVDTSDGICEASRLLADASSVAITLAVDRIPWHPGLARSLPDAGDRLRVAAYGGDYELLAAVPARAVPRALGALARVGTAGTVVGEVGTGRGAFSTENGRTRPLPPTSWDPFRARDGRGSAIPTHGRRRATANLK